MSDNKSTEVIQRLVQTIGKLLNERTEFSLASKLVEGLVVRLHNPKIPIGEQVVITYHTDPNCIGVIGELKPNPRSARKFRVTSFDGGVYNVDDITWVEAINAKYQRRASVVVDGKIIISKFNPRNLQPTIGAVVLVDVDSGYAVAITDYKEISLASMVTNVRRVIDDSHVEVDNNRVVYNVDFKLEEGDEVLVDPSGTIVLDKIKSNVNSVVSTKTSEKHRVEWDDVIGLTDVKTRIVESIIQPIKYKSVYTKYGMDKSPKGMVLAGPPGCGKTMIGRAIATAIADASGSMMTDSGFIYVKSTELLDPYVGESEKRVRTLFLSAGNHYEKTGVPGVIFIDEADAVMGTRGRGNGYHSLVAPFLTEMDGFDTQKTFVILATNRLDVIDPAITRNGRLDFKITVDRPDKDSSKQILRSYLRKTELAESLDSLVDAGINEFWSDDSVLGTRNSGMRVVCMRARDAVNGAMLKSVADESINLAIRREIAALTGGKTAGTIGVTSVDVINAVKSVVSQNAILSHDDVWEDMITK